MLLTISKNLGIVIVIICEARVLKFFFNFISGVTAAISAFFGHQSHEAKQ